MARIDHVILNVDDLDEAAGELGERYGLIALPGGVFPDGVANPLIPLDPPQYLELIAIVDREVAEREMPSDELRDFDSRKGWMGWAISGVDIDEVSARTGVDPVAGSIQDPQGATVSSWQYVAPEDDEGGALPFYVAYDQTAQQRLAVWTERASRAEHHCGPASLAWVKVAVEERKLRRWIGNLELPLRRVGGSPGVRSVCLRTGDRELVIR